MIRTALLAGLLACAATPAMAQNGPPPSPFAPLQDRPTCTRDELKAATDAYVEAQRTGNIGRLPLHEKVRFVQDMADVARDAGLWNTALPIAHAMSFHDDKRCKTFTEIIVTEGGKPYVIGTRLYLHQGKVLRVDSLVTKPGDWLFNANAYQKYSSQEDWSAPKGGKATMVELINAANNYLDLFSDKFVPIPWGKPCARLEGGAYTNREGKADATCEVGIPPGVLYIVNRDYIVDEEQSVINVYCRFGNSTTGMPDSHTFRLVNGRISHVHTISVNLSDKPSPQADDNGAIIR